MKLINTGIILLVLTSVLISCKKNETTVNNNNTGDPALNELSSFIATVIERNHFRAIVKWSESKSTNTQDTVKYKVVINNTLIDSNLNTLTDSLLNIFYANNYSGAVIAYTRSGLSKTASFTLESLAGQCYVANNSSLKSNNIFTNSVIDPIIWHRSVRSFNTSTPVISNDTLFFSTETGNQGIISAQNAINGSTYWSISPGYSVGMGSNITYNSGNLYACTYSGLVVLNAKNGSLVWKYLRPNPSNTNLLLTNPVIANNKVFAGTQGNSGVIMAIDISTGTPIWEFPVSGQLSPTPVAVNDMVLFNAGNKVYALDQNSGAIKWSQNNLGNSWNSPLISGDKVIVYNGSGTFSALNLSTGALLWSKHYTGPGLSTALATGNGMCYFSTTVTISTGNYQSKLMAINVSDGQLVWEYLTIFEGVSNLICANNSLYVAGYGFYNRIWRFNAFSGNNEPLAGVESGKFLLTINNKLYYNHENGNYK